MHVQIMGAQILSFLILPAPERYQARAGNKAGLKSGVVAQCVKLVLEMLTFPIRASGQVPPVPLLIQFSVSVQMVSPPHGSLLLIWET